MLLADIPETEATPDDEAIRSLLASDATHLLLAEYAVEEDRSFAELHRLVPAGEHEHPFVLAANNGSEWDDDHLVFSSWRAAEDAFAWYVDLLRKNHEGSCDAEPDKCKHAPPWTPPTPKTARRKTKKRPGKPS